MNKEEIINEIRKYYPLYNKEIKLSALEFYETSEIKMLKILLEKNNSNEDLLNIPKWFVLKKWPKPVFTRQANVPDVMWPYFSIWIHDFVNGCHYTISASHIIPFFLVYEWKNKNIPSTGFDYFAERLNRKEYFNNLIFEGFNPSSIVDIPIGEVEKLYSKYLGVKLFTRVEILEEIVPEIYFEYDASNKFKFRDLFDGLSKYKLNKPMLDELGSGLI